MLKPLLLRRKMQKEKHENPCITYYYSDGRITVKFCPTVAHGKPIPHTKQNSKISTDLIMLKFERFGRKVLNFKRLYLIILWIKHTKNCWGC